MKDQTKPTNLGNVVSVRGSVVDIRFDAQLPPIYSVLRAGNEQRIVIEVLEQRDARHVRGIALTPTQGLARGMGVEDTGGPLKAPVGKWVLSRMFDVFGNAIDVLVPLKRGGQTSAPRICQPPDQRWSGYRRADHRVCPALGARAAYVKQAIRDKLLEHKAYIQRYGEDMPEIRNWQWKGQTK